jgi:hypothetical protein
MVSFLLQACFLSAIALVLFRSLLHHTWLYCSAWAVAVIAIRYKYGADGEDLFYSNDQRYHKGISDVLVELGVSNDWNYMLRGGRLAYTVPAALLHWIGFDTLLSLKFISLMGFLGSAVLASRVLERAGLKNRVVFCYLLLLGPAGLFFSALALRETVMIFFVTFSLTTRRLGLQSLALIAIMTLRPHLAVALIVGLCLAPIASSLSRHFYFLTVALVLYVPATLGNLGYSLGVWALDGAEFSLANKWLSSESLTRIFSNLVGLQFLTADARSTELSFADLMLARIPFFETILIPILFTMTILFAPVNSTLRWRVFTAFSFYLGLVTVTDFNSFRQNVPFMTLFGILVLTEGLIHQTGIISSRAIRHAETSS